MTHSIDTPFPPPPPATGPGTQTTSTGDSSSTSDVAKGEARNVGQSAAEGAEHVASTATDQAKDVVQETKAQAQDVVAQGRDQLRQQVVGSQQKAAQGLSGIAEQLRGMADGTGSPSGPAKDLVSQGADKVQELARFLENREPADLLHEVRSFARRKPGTFLLGAALAGVAAGRLTSGVKAAHSDSGSSGGSGQHSAAPANYVHPAPEYSGYAGTAADVRNEPIGEYQTPVAPAAPGYGNAPVPPPPYGTTPPAGGAVPPTTPAGWDDPARRPGEGV